MPFCPGCHYEYEPTMSICPDCDEKLVDVLPEEPQETEYRDWTPIVRLTAEQYAEMIVDALRAEKIPVVAQSGAGHFGQTGQMGPSSFRAVGGGYSLLVPLQFVEQADQIGFGLLGEEWEKARLIDLK